MRIAYCFHSLFHHGGVEKILTTKANYLVQNFGFEVFIITYNQGDNPIFFELDDRIKVIDLEVGEFKYHKSNFIKSKIAYQEYKKEFKNKLTNVLKKINPDYSISLGGAEFYILNSIQEDGSIKLAEYHVTIGAFETINGNLTYLQKIRAKFSFQKFVNNIKKYNKFIVLTNGDAKEWSLFSKNVISIPNPQTFKINHDVLSIPREKLALAVGRFEPEKQLDQLILIWKEVVNRYPDWKLILKGSGSQKDYYQKLIHNNNLEANVLLEQPSAEMVTFYENASMYLMASKFEGFSLVMLEAMQSGLPIIAYNCKYGPSELINDTENGFLVELNNREYFLEKIFQLIENEELRRKMSIKAIENAKKYEIEKVMNIWKNLFEKLNNDK